jgi:rubrerythrin
MAAHRPDTRAEDTRAEASWSMEDIPYHALAHDRVRDDRRLFYIVASASFIESASDVYTDNLVRFFHDDGEIVAWLRQHWEPEERQHGAALRRYVRTAWPDFDWEAAYRTFVADYSPLCAVDRLAGTRALEMAARCVVETGTAAFYRMLSQASEEPVLRGLAARIGADEVRHYKHFYRWFRRYRAIEQPSQLAVLRTLWSRATDVESEDALCAYKALLLGLTPGATFRRRDYEAHRAAVLTLAKQHLPRDMAIKMLLKPLGLGPTVGRAVVPAATSASRFFLQRYAANP